MTGTSIVIAALEAAITLAAGRPLTEQGFPIVIALLIIAAVLTCMGSISLNATTDRKGAKGATLRNMRTLSGPMPRRRS